LNKNLNVHASYTNTKILELSKDFDEVEASLAYGNLTITTESGTSYKLESEARYGNIKVAQDDKLSRSKETTTTKVWGTVGSNPKGSMNLITKYGDIEID